MQPENEEQHLKSTERKKKNCQLRIVYPVEIPSKTEGERKLLNV